MLIDPDFRSRPSTLLGWQHFQTAYVTNDMDRAIEDLASQYGIKDFFFLRDVPFQTGGKIDVALAWAGTMNLEIIHGKGNPDSLYQRGLPEEYTLAFHHLGYLVPSETEWNQLEQTIAAQKMEIVLSGSDPSGLDFIYIKAPVLGHYLEYVRPHSAWVELFDNLPRN